MIERRKAIARTLNQFLGTDRLSPADTEIASTSLTALIESGESATTEFKSTLRFNLKSGQHDVRIEHEVLKTLAAFLSSDGGVLVIGVDDSGKPLGISADNFANEDKMNVHLTNIIKERMGAQHMRFINPQFEDYEGERALIVKCKSSREPVYVKNGNMEHFYMRAGAATAELTGEKMQQFIRHRFAH